MSDERFVGTWKLKSVVRKSAATLLAKIKAEKKALKRGNNLIFVLAKPAQYSILQVH